MSRVLVTGASGFVGSRAVPLLVAAGHEVHVVGRTASVAFGARAHIADLLEDPAGVVGEVRPDTLLHLAWTTEHGAFWTSPDNVRWLESSLALLRAFVAVGGARAVVAGTCAEYSWETTAPVLAEDAPLAPATLYGAAKAALLGAGDSFLRQEGVDLAWGRVFFPYGAGEAPGRLVTSVALSLLRGEPAETTAGDQARDFIHADDVAGAFAALVVSPVSGPVNIATGRATTVREVAELTAAAAGRPDLLRAGSRPPRAGDPASLVADVTRLEREVGYRPHVSLADGIAATVDALRAS